MQIHVLDYLEKIVKEKPEKIAYSNGTESLTFEEVYKQSQSTGSFLYEKGIYRRPVVVFMSKSPKEVAAFFGVVTGGCFYVPIDEEMPAGRIQLILDNVQALVIICDETTEAIACTFELNGGEIVRYEEIVDSEIRPEALKLIHDRTLETDPMYIVFTSGSTGIPKGVITSHRAVIDYIEQLSEVLEFSEETVFGNQTPLYVDACLKELYSTIKFGATTYLIPKKYFSMPVELVEFLNRYQINTICWVVSALTMISTFDTFHIVKPEYLRTIAFGSEVFPVKQLKKWRKAVPEAQFTNLYGPTEATGMCCYYRVEREFNEDEMIPIGKPFDNREILLITEEGKLAKPGEAGEICIRSTSLALGYYNDPVRTREAFVQNPFQQAYAERIYKTGDIGRYNESGELMFVSRKDHQIKHMGHRIELGEIEMNASLIQDVQSTACIYDTKKGKLVLYFAGRLSEKEFIAHLKKRLPRYMIPNKTIRLESLPLTANGKTDRMALKKIYENMK